MNHKPFDTLETFDHLVKTGFPPDAARALCKIHKGQHDVVYDGFVHKDDLEGIVTKIIWKQVLGTCVIVGCVVAIWTLDDQLKHHELASVQSPIPKTSHHLPEMSPAR